MHRGLEPLPATARTTSPSTSVGVTGLSGITWLGGARYAAVLDNSDRILLLTVELGEDGTPTEIRDTKVVTVSAAHDYEDIAAAGPESDGTRRLFLCEEDTPAVRIARFPGGQLEGLLPLPEVFRSRRPNRGLEGLALDPDGRYLWTANEEPLEEDGPEVAEGRGGVVRLVRLDTAAVAVEGTSRVKVDVTNKAPGPLQVAYAVDPPHGFIRIVDAPLYSGLVALVALGEGRLLLLERSAGGGLPPFSSRIYLVDTTSASDISGVERDLTAVDPVAKQLLWEGALGTNLEGLCLGPELAGGGRALLGVVDNGGLGTPNQLAAFVLRSTDEQTPVTSP